jgi:hypothetical protein
MLKITSIIRCPLSQDLLMDILKSALQQEHSKKCEQGEEKRG